VGPAGPTLSLSLSYLPLSLLPLVNALSLPHPNRHRGEPGALTAGEVAASPPPRSGRRAEGHLRASPRPREVGAPRGKAHSAGAAARASWPGAAAEGEAGRAPPLGLGRRRLPDVQAGPRAERRRRGGLRRGEGRGSRAVAECGHRRGPVFLELRGGLGACWWPRRGTRARLRRPGRRARRRGRNFPSHGGTARSGGIRRWPELLRATGTHGESSRRRVNAVGISQTLPVVLKHSGDTLPSRPMHRAPLQLSKWVVTTVSTCTRHQIAIKPCLQHRSYLNKMT
jgi:hypothetical protein